MNVGEAIVGVALSLWILWETFETIVLPRTVNRKLRLTKVFYVRSWLAVRWIAKRLRGSRREAFLFIYGPMSLLALIGVWILLLMLGFAMIHDGLGTPMSGSVGPVDFLTYLYHSGVTLFTLGYGDVTPIGGIGRFVAVTEAGVGFGFLAVVISYLPVLYQSYAKREAFITLLDSRAGSPPTSCELLSRYGGADDVHSISALLAGWEIWISELLESHLSYPVLVFYRSQHERQSWISALGAILDTCAIASLGVYHGEKWQKQLGRQAQLTFAMARHAIVDLSYVINVPIEPWDEDRLTEEQWKTLTKKLGSSGVTLCEFQNSREELGEVRKTYEPYLIALAKRLEFHLPPFAYDVPTRDNWETALDDEAIHV